MTDAELSSLEAAARAATPGPWTSHFDGNVWVMGPTTDHKSICLAGYARNKQENIKNATYIAAANPSGVLELIAELRQAKAERDWLADKLESIEWPLLTTWIEVAKEATCQKN